MRKPVKPVPTNNLLPLREAAGLKQAHVAEAIGLKGKHANRTYQRWEAMQINIPEYAKPRLADLFGVTIDRLYAMDPRLVNKKIIKEDGKPRINDSTKMAILATPIVPYTSEKIPVYKLIGEKGVEKINHDAPAGWRFKPTMLANIEGLYAIEQHDNSADPRYRIGEHLYLSPRHPLPGEDCVIQLKKGGVMLRQFISQDGKEAKYFQYNPAKNGKVSLAEINFIHSVERP